MDLSICKSIVETHTGKIWVSAAALWAKSGHHYLFDDSIRSSKQRRWNFKAEGLSGLKIDHKLEF
jgi:signal transduction histidine kinase